MHAINLDDYAVPRLSLLQEQNNKQEDLRSLVISSFSAMRMKRWESLTLFNR